MILLVNDDGYMSKNLKVLYEYCSTIDDEVEMIVPSEDKSGVGNYFSNTKTFTPFPIEEGYILDGTPVDCVRYGLSKYSPTLIISGINKGFNLGKETLLHSGTFMGAREGYLNNIKSLSCSFDYKKEITYPLVKEVLDKVLERDFQLANLNIVSPTVYDTVLCPTIYEYQFDGDDYKLIQKNNYDEGSDGHVVLNLDKSSLTIIR